MRKVEFVERELLPYAKKPEQLGNILWSLHLSSAGPRSKVSNHVQNWHFEILLYLCGIYSAEDIQTRFKERFEASGHNLRPHAPSHPVQLWFGRFIHAVLEESYRMIKEERTGLPPWSQPELDGIFDRIDRLLAAQNIICWDADSEKLGRRRATSAVNEMGPILFPLINQAEVRVRGARKLPLPASGATTRRDIDRYEMQGVIDVVTHLVDVNIIETWLLLYVYHLAPSNIWGGVWNACLRETLFT